VEFVPFDDLPTAPPGSTRPKQRGENARLEATQRKQGASDQKLETQVLQEDEVRPVTT
jgi:hypothetical protein